MHSIPMTFNVVLLGRRIARSYGTAFPESEELIEEGEHALENLVDVSARPHARRYCRTIQQFAQ